MSYRLYWGDLHNHCSISYGHGTVEQALARAREQLDFCTVTGHAFWPDMPTDQSRYAEIIAYHHEGFGRLARNWVKLLAKLEAAHEDGRFVTLPSYEWHSREYGDHILYAPGPRLALRDAPDLPGLRELAREAGGILIPHHIGYRAGYRGIDWRHFRPEQTPFVELFSLHGCSESEYAPYPMLHDMGPRDAGSTAEAGWALGHRFGVIASTDQHAAFPGSHGDGRAGVFARELTREGLFEAFRARRVLAATGDRLDARLFVEEAWMGSEIRAAGSRRVRFSVAGQDALERVELLKNGRVIRRAWPEAAAGFGGGAARLRVTWGWGRQGERMAWRFRLVLSDGALRRVDPCFVGPAVVSPQPGTGDAEVADAEDLPHQVLERGARAAAWRSVTAGNHSMRHALVQGLSLELDAPLSARVEVEVNGERHAHALGELLRAGRTHFLGGHWLAPALRVGPLVPLDECRAAGAFCDEPEADVDVYRLRAAQHNGQWVWSSPIWVER